MLTPDNEALLRTFVARYLEQLPGDPAVYTSDVAADDLDAVRVALGYEQINLAMRARRFDELVQAFTQRHDTSDDRNPRPVHQAYASASASTCSTGRRGERGMVSA